MTQWMHHVTTYKESNVYDLRFICCMLSTWGKKANLELFYISFTPLLSLESVVRWTSISLLSLPPPSSAHNNHSFSFFHSLLELLFPTWFPKTSITPSKFSYDQVLSLSPAFSLSFTPVHLGRGGSYARVSRGSSVRFPPAGVSLSPFSRSQWGQGMAAALCPSLSCPTMPPCP